MNPTRGIKNGVKSDGFLLYIVFNVHNNKGNFKWPAHLDLMKRVPLKNPIMIVSTIDSIVSDIFA